MKIKPKPCPFCGKTYRGKIFAAHLKADRFECPSCGAEGPFPDYKKAQVKGKPQEYYDRLTIDAWNRRAEGA